MTMSRRHLLYSMAGSLSVLAGAAAAEELRLFQPRTAGRPARTETGGTRGISSAPVAVLLPPGTAFSAEPSPVIPWFLSRAFAGRVEVSLTPTNGDAPVLREVIRRGVKPGIYRLGLADSGKSLTPGLDHIVKVTLVRDPSDRSQDVVSTGTVQYAPHQPFADARAAGAAGYWLDALALADPETYADLLDEVELSAAASWLRARQS
ncbi:MAG TPA: DUF928 domain-containing protein [Geminicoccus sp.]|jgi:hypothetical protein|uniref:DUF928 domain-containing protein n=1 Tax=Geminicoccus sp. TaxID=2024832 RepID=UPI002E34AC01|nr:DUF928 domain-containing protein [Geminicoccus sp.]HEX2526412.1 DUF928 domain-containing protein [Geminicoccus sp.]